MFTVDYLKKKKKTYTHNKKVLILSSPRKPTAITMFILYLQLRHTGYHEVFALTIFQVN